MEEQKKKAEERREKKRRQSMPLPPRERIELLPSPPPRPLRMDEEEIKEREEAVPKRTETQEALSIRGAAASTAKLSLAERLAKAKAEAAANSPNLNPPQPSPPVPTPPPLVHSISEPTQPAMNKPGVRAAVQARLKLRLKLASEKRSYVFNLNESRAQELRAKILEAKARREADETDAVLREMDKVDRAREVRRRLMVLKMMAAETESERRARELKEKLLGDRKAKMLKAKLLERKNKAKEQAAEAVTG
jgi:E3 ubiquitin-protein ligase Topors